MRHKINQMIKLRVCFLAFGSTAFLWPAAQAQTVVDFDGSARSQAAAMRETAWQQFLRGFLGRPMRPSRVGKAIPAVHKEGHKIWEQAELLRSGYKLTPNGIQDKNDERDDPATALSLTNPAHRAKIEAIVRDIARRNHLEGDSRFIPAFIKALRIIQPCLTDHSLPQCRNGGSQDDIRPIIAAPPEGSHRLRYP